MTAQELATLPFRQLVALNARQKKTHDLVWGDDFTCRTLYEHLRPALIKQLSQQHQEVANGTQPQRH